MWAGIVALILFFFLVDGIKLLIESYSKVKKINYTSDPEKVSVIIPCYNKEQTILDTLESIIDKFPEENIYVIDDGSTDNSYQVIKNSKYKINLYKDKNKGKIKAINSMLNKIKTPYVFIVDSDIILDKSFSVPTGLLESSSATAVAFNVLPNFSKPSDFISPMYLIKRFQFYEYLKSMIIGKQTKVPSKSVHCISGAAGLFDTYRLKILSKNHSGIFEAEDLERTLLELSAHGKVLFSDRIVYTDVPGTFLELTKQRLTSWWPGLWRHFFTFLKFIILGKVSKRLKFELLYEIFSLLTDPLKIIGLTVAIATGDWLILLVIYLFYLFFESIAFHRLKHLFSRTFEDYEILILYPIYSLYQMILRFLALFYAIILKLTKWRKK